MRTSTKAATVLLLFALPTLGQVTKSGLTLGLECPSSKWILGERVTVIATWKNLGDAPLVVAPSVGPRSRFTQLHVVGNTRSDCVVEQRSLEEGAPVPNPPKLDPGKSITISATLTDAGIVDAGHYEVWLEYNTTGAADYLLKAGLAPIRVESNHVSFDIGPPRGLDARIFSQYGRACNQLALSPKEMLEKYPTSIYAGYAFLCDGQCIPDPRVFMTDLLGFDSHALKSPESSTQMAADKKRSLDADNTRVDQLTSYLKSHPDFARADCLKLELAGRMAALQRFQESEAICNELTSASAPSESAKKAQLLLAFLVEKGCIKPAATAPASPVSKAPDPPKGKSS
jgi:hypothetical protein